MNWPKLLALPALTVCLATVLPNSAQAQITSGGDGTAISPSGSSTINITGGTQAGSNLFHSFDQFNVDAGRTANFVDPGVQNILGRVTGGNASLINGVLQVTGGNANLYLMNPAGIIFGSGASLSVPGSFTATTANGIGFEDNWFNAIGSNDYANLIGNPNNFAFTMAMPGAIANAGNLVVGQGQSITLLGGTVINTGTLTAPEGGITITAVPGEKLVRLSQDGSLLSLALPVETGTTVNTLPFTPLSLPQLLAGGNLGNATGVTVEGDVVRLTGSGVAVPTEAGTAIVSNAVNVSGETGGTVYVLGDKVGLVDANIDASGTHGGGTILVGGDYKGEGTVPNAQQTYVSADSVINVDALYSGDGGRAIAWADKTTEFYGNLSAQGGLESGNGGFVEISGKENLTFQGRVDVSAANGASGTVLLDPESIFIVDGSSGADDAELTSDREILASDGGDTSYVISETALESLTGEVTLEAANLIFVNDLADNELSLDKASSVTFRTTNFGGGSTFRMEDPNDTLSAQNGTIDIESRSIGISNIATNGGDITLNGDVLLTGDAVISTGAATPGNIEIGGRVHGYDWNTRTTTPRSLTISAGQGDVTLIQEIGSGFSTPSINQLDVSANSIQFPNFPGSPVSENITISANGNVLLKANTDIALEKTQLQVGGDLVLQAGANTDIVLQETQLQVGGDLVLQAGRNINFQDGLDPAIAQADGNFTIQGNTSINLEGYRHPDSRIESGGNLSLISDGAILANTPLISGGTFSTQRIDGDAANFQQTIPSFNTLISSVGDVSFGNYEGPSLKIETQGSITAGNITILNPNSSLSGSDPDIPLLTSRSTLILEAGVNTLQNAPNLLPGLSAGGTPIASTDSASSPATITVGNITTARGNAAGPVRLSAPGEIQTGDIWTQDNVGNGAPSPVTISSGSDVQTGDILAVTSDVSIAAGGNLQTEDIDTIGFGNTSSVKLQAENDIQVSTISTGAGGIDVTAGGSFRALGYRESSFSNDNENDRDAIVNDPDLINYLVSLGFSREELLTANVRLLNLAKRPSLISNPSEVPDGELKSPIIIRYGDQKQTIVDRSYSIRDSSGTAPSRLLILGDSNQAFRMGPRSSDNVFAPSNSDNRIEDYHPVTNNFGFRVTETRTLTYGTAEFPTDASGLVGSVAVGAGSNSGLYGSFQGYTFTPISTGNPSASGADNSISSGTNNPSTSGTGNPSASGADSSIGSGTNNPSTSGTGNLSASGTDNSVGSGTNNPSTSGTGNPSASGADNSQEVSSTNSICAPSSTIVSTSGARNGSDRSGRATFSANISNSSCSSLRDSSPAIGGDTGDDQILKLLDGGVR